MLFLKFQESEMGRLCHRSSMSLFSDSDSSESEDTFSPCETHRASPLGADPATPKAARRWAGEAPQTQKTRLVTTWLEALPTGAVLREKSGRHWKLASLQTRWLGLWVWMYTPFTGGPGHLRVRAKGGEPPFETRNGSHSPAADQPLTVFS